jgi:hypothetical protein
MRHFYLSFFLIFFLLIIRHTLSQIPRYFNLHNYIVFLIFSSTNSHHYFSLNFVILKKILLYMKFMITVSTLSLTFRLHFWVHRNSNNLSLFPSLFLCNGRWQSIIYFWTLCLESGTSKQTLTVPYVKASLQQMNRVLAKRPEVSCTHWEGHRDASRHGSHPENFYSFGCLFLSSPALTTFP